MTVLSASDSNAILKLNNVTIGFGDGPDVLRGVDLQIRRREFVSIVGPSGGGKSTILNAVAGLLIARSGDVFFDGKQVGGINTDVGYMTQGDTLLPWRTVYDNIAFPLRLRKFDRQEIDANVKKWLEILDLSEASSKFPSQLSGGMKRRALLARSMIYDPLMLLMDEPFAALDAQLRTQMHIELRRTVRSAEQTVLFVTHDINEAALLSDRVIVLGERPGRPVADIPIDLGVERDIEALRYDADFVELEQHIHEVMAEWNHARHGNEEAAS